MQIEEYVRSKGWAYEKVDSERGIQLKVQRCPFCADDNGHFYINAETGQYMCHKGTCGVSGSIYTLKKHVGDIAAVHSMEDYSPAPPKRTEEEESKDIDLVNSAHLTLMSDKGALRYLAHRRFSHEAIEYFKLGLDNSNGVKWLFYPYLSKGKVKNIKMRSLPPSEKMFRRLFGGESALFNEDVLDDKSIDSIFITEGESDAVALWSSGIHNVVGVTVGAKGIRTNWIDSLDRFASIYFVYDSDIAGRQGAIKFANRLGLERCFNVRLPKDYKDINDYLQSHTAEDFQKLVAEAHKFDVDSVRPIGALIEESVWNLYSRADEEGFDFPWHSLTKLTGLLKPGDLFVVAAKPGVGKTTFSLNLAYHLASKNIPILLFELEMRPERLLPRLVARHLKKKDSNNLEDLTKAYTDMRDMPMYFAYKYTKLDFQSIADTIQACVRRYGIRFVIFDNLHFLVRGSDITREIGTVTRDFKMLAEETGIAMLLIARPKKVGAGRMIDTEDLKDSADIEGDSDFVLLLHREKKKAQGWEHAAEGILEPKCFVEVGKARWAGGGICSLTFHDDIALITEG